MRAYTRLNCQFTKIATVFGRFLGPKGKMPNPKIGSILPPNANVKPLIDKLRKTVNLATKNEPTIKCSVGKEDMDEGVIDNILTVYNSVIQKLPNEKQNIKSVLLKLTMGPAFVIGKNAEEKDDKKKGKKEKITKEKPKEEIKKEAKQEKKVPEKEKPVAKTEETPKKQPKTDQ